ncbi:MAG: photosynthetic complex putative assembly protein PuhB [Pseudomonadota bacterium]
MEHSDFKTDPIPGLPELLPAGEEILWRGRPQAWRLAVEAMWLNWVIGYFAVLAVWRAALSATQMPLGAALLTAVPLVVLGLVVTGLIYGMAYLQARATIYTLTSARVVMRIGAVLNLTVNLPFTRMAAAHLTKRRDGSGTIVFETVAETRMSAFMLWPHIRPWHLRRPQPALRCIPEVADVAELLADATDTVFSEPKISSAPVPEGVAA